MQENSLTQGTVYDWLAEISAPLPVGWAVEPDFGLSFPRQPSGSAVVMQCSGERPEFS